MKKTIFALSLFCAASSVLAKLPAASFEAVASAAEKAALATWKGKSDAYALCKRQDTVSSNYLKSSKGRGKTATDASTCTNPGAFVYVKMVIPKSIEAAGAHSSAGTAVRPATAAVKSAVPTPAKKS